MRLILIVMVALPLAALCQSKKNLPSFGKVSKEELLNSTCEFDKDAEAMVLYESGRWYLDIGNNGYYDELVHHVRIKILNEKGVDRANVKLRYTSKLNSEAITNLSANTYNLDESGNIVTTKLEKNLVYRKKLNSYVTEQAFTMPAVKVGSVIEYKYTWRGFDKRSWTLQWSIPVKFSRYEVNFPSMFELYIRPSASLPFSSTDESTGLRTIKQFSMQDIPALRNEKYITCPEDYLQKIDAWLVAYTINNRRYPLLKSWPELAKDMLQSDYIGDQIKKQLPGVDELKLSVAAIGDPYKKMVAVHEYVRKHMSWNGVDNYWAAGGVKGAWKDRKGSSGDINLILINLLREVGLQVNPILVSTRENGRVTTLFPDRSQFNKLLAYVKLADRTYVLDGVDKHTPAGMIPYDVMFTEGLMLDPSIPHNFSWEPIWDSVRQDRNVVVFMADVKEDGTVKGKATVTSYDYARSKRIRDINDKETFPKRYLDIDNANLNVDSLKFKNVDADTLPLVQEFEFAGVLNNSGEYNFVSTNLFSGLGSNPFIADTRYSDVFFGTNQRYMVISSVKIPDGYTFEDVPKDVRMMLPDRSLQITRMSSSSGNTINTKLVVEFKRPYYSPEEYPDLKAFYKKMYELLEEQVVIKKKTNDQAQN